MKQLLLSILFSFVAGGVAGKLFLPNRNGEVSRRGEEGKKYQTISRDLINSQELPQKNYKMELRKVLAYIKDNKGMMNSDTEIKSILYGIWAESDPEGAIKSFGVMVPSSIFYEASWYRGIVPSVPIAIAKSIARSDPERATEYIKEQHLKRYFNLVSEYLINLYHNDKQIAYQQLDHFSGEAKLTGISGIAGVWGKEEEWVDIQGKINDLSPDLQDVARSSASVRKKRN